MSEEFRKAGISFLRKLGRYADLILDTYLEGELPIHYEADTKTIDDLIQKQVLWRPGSNEGLHLTRSIRGMLDQVLKDEKNRQLDVNMGSSIALIKTLIGHYKEAQAKNNYHDAIIYLRDIGEHVFSIIESLRMSVRSLWAHINNEFGMVGTLSAKIRENELAQKQVKLIVVGLEMFDFNDLSELAGSNPQLRKLLIVNLQREVSECSSELSSVQTRLFNMMGHFKEMQARSTLVKGFQIFMDNHPDFKPNCYPEQSDLPLLFNQIEPIRPLGLLDITIENHEATLIDIVQSVRVSNRNQNKEVLPSSGLIQLREAQEIEISEKAEKLAVEDFFCRVLDAEGKKVSAIEYYNEIDFGWGAEFWLFAVIGNFYELDQETSALFDYEIHSTPHAVFTGNQFITDVELWVN